MSVRDLNRELEYFAMHAIQVLNQMQIPRNAAIVFDIDDTLLDKNGKRIHSVASVYDYAKMIGITPIIVTSRPSSPTNVEWTQKQLHSIGITAYESMYFQPSHNTNSWETKLAARRDIHSRGFTVIMSMGDQPWDIGEYGGLGYKLPTVTSYGVLPGHH